MTAGGQHGAGVTAPGGHPRGNAAICPLAEGRPWPGPAPRSGGCAAPHATWCGTRGPRRSPGPQQIIVLPSRGFGTRQERLQAMDLQTAS